MKTELHAFVWSILNILFKYTYVLFRIYLYEDQERSRYFTSLYYQLILGRGECITYQGWSLSSHHLTYIKKSVQFFSFCPFLVHDFEKINWKGDNLLVISYKIMFLQRCTCTFFKLFLAIKCTWLELKVWKCFHETRCNFLGYLTLLNVYANSRIHSSYIVMSVLYVEYTVIIWKKPLTCQIEQTNFIT